MKKQIKQYVQLRNVLRATDQQFIVFFKGPVLADLYPNYLERSSSDTDIWVPEGQYAKTEQSLLDLGYVKNEGIYIISYNCNLPQPTFIDILF